MTIVIYGSPSGTSIGSGLRGAQSFTTALGDNIIYAWGAQLEQSSTVGEYIPTTSTINSAPRFDHNPTTGESLGLLVEEQRTNLLVRSEEFDNASWTKTNASVTANAIVAPDGVLSGDSVTCTTDGSFNGRVSQGLTALSIGIVVTFSFFAKRNNNDWISASCSMTNSKARRCWWNLNTGTIGGTTTASAGGETLVSHTITPVGDGWYRCAMTLNPNAEQVSGTQLVQNSNGDTDTAATNGQSFYIWGAQLEAGAFPTSYIPTTTATVTRSADVCSISGSNFSSWYNASEGTIFCDHLEARPNTGVIYGFANTFDNSFYVVPGATNNVLSFTAGNNQASLNLNITGAGPFRHASAYQLNNFGASLNGGSISSDTVALVPSGPVRFAFGTAPWSLGTAQLNSRIRRLTYWPTRLPNSTLQAVTQ
jgi:hypothetical protein